MDFVKLSGVDISRTVIVSGVTNTEADEEILDCLKRYGSIKNVVTVDDSTSKYYKNLIVEFSHCSALDGLQPLLPYAHPSPTVPDATYHVKALAGEYTSTLGGDRTTEYLTELKKIANHSGMTFEEVLKDMMCRISEEVEEQGSEDGDIKPVIERASPSPDKQELLFPSSPVLTQRPVSLSRHDLNPPEIQRVVVEHIVRRDDISSHSLVPFRLRAFSGKCPKPSSEADFETWRSHIEFLLADPSLSPLNVTRRILESLLSPAADVVKGLGPEALPVRYLQVLDSAFATVQDGEELFAQFLNTLQDSGERPSSYLQRLQLNLNSVLKRGGILSTEIEKHLLRQFCRGCWDNSVITNLQLEQKKENPPSFSELLFLLRTEEDRQLSKENRMKKHISSSKQRVQVQSQTACTCGAKSDNDLSGIDDLRKQMNKLQSQLTSLLSQKTQLSSKHNPRQVEGAKSQPVSTTWIPQSMDRDLGTVSSVVRMATLLHHAVMQPTRL